jgi:ADP-heptose:LPS heptosyltransferase
LRAKENLARYFDSAWEKGKVRILLNSSGTTRAINEGEFKFLIDEIASKFAGRVDLLLLNNRRNRKYFNMNALKVSQALSLEGFIALASTADSIITPHTSLVHIACAFNKYLISFFANSPETPHWAPLSGKKYKVIMPCKPDETMDDIKNLKDFDREAALGYAKEFIEESERLRAGNTAESYP